MPDKLDESVKKLEAAYLFPGQGSQSVGMGQELYDNSLAARGVFLEVDRALGRPLTELIFHGPEEELRETENAQPAIMAVSLACVKAIEECLEDGDIPRPVVVAGHSLGEYTALAVAGVLDVSDTVRLVQERGRLMQEACDQRQGTMVAILGLGQEIVEDISSETGTYVSNVNTEEQIVVSGDREAVTRAIDVASARGAKKVVPLRVSGAFHSVLMKPAVSGLKDAIGKLSFKDPLIPIVANCTGKPITKAKDVKQELISQVSSCVMWKQSIDYIIGSGISCLVEIGPGKALSSMVRRIDRTVGASSIGDFKSIINLRSN